MTEVLAVGTRCALCKRRFKDDEGVGLFRRDRVVWLHRDCSRRLKRRLKKRKHKARSLARRKRKRSQRKVRAPTRRSGRVGTL